MAVSPKIQKMLWGRAAARCAYPGCRRHLIEDVAAGDDPTLAGHNCHIVADRDDGPRGDPTMPVQERNSYGNLILLCSVHHKIVDDNAAIWTVAALKEIKRKHEAWVERSLGIAPWPPLHGDLAQVGYAEHLARIAYRTVSTVQRTRITRKGSFLAVEADDSVEPVSTHPNLCRGLGDRRNQTDATGPSCC